MKLHRLSPLVSLSLLSSSVVTFQQRRFFYRRLAPAATTKMSHNGCCHNNSDSEDSAVSSDDDHKRIRLPVLKYGYRTEPLDWDELVDILTVQKDLYKLSRSVEQQLIYEVYKRDLLLQWSCVMDHVLCDKFPNVFEKRFDARIERYAAYPPLQDVAASGAIHMSLVQNDFPYYMVDHIEHWVLWKLGGVCSDSDIDKAKSQLLGSGRFFADELLHWANPPHLKSLPEVDHIHILCRALPTTTNRTAHDEE
jgi:hypothetical protein